MGRFTQPDSISPNFSDPQSLNRYSYASNNPIMYFDPSGHMAEVIPGGDPLPPAPVIPSGNQTPEDVPEDDNPDDEVEELTADGEEVYELYVALNNELGWWNNYQLGGMSPYEFIGIYIMWERNANPNTLWWLAEVVKNQLWMDATSVGGNAPYCNGDYCFNGLFNFIAAYAGKYNALRFSSDKMDHKEWLWVSSEGENSWGDFMDKAAEVGEYVATIGRVLEFDLNEPFGWGNIDAARYEAQISPLSEGIYRDEIVRSINPDFIIYTTNQWVELLKDKGTILYSIE